MTDEESDDEQRDPIFKPRERAFIALSTSIALVVGLWLGHWLVPAEAFAEHITYNSTVSGNVRVHYRPTHTLLPIGSLGVLAVGAWVAYTSFQEIDEEALDD